MNKGIGVDITEIHRIAKLMESTQFLERYFSKAERDMFAAKKHPAPSVAANFAAKEAFSKAIGTGVRGFNLCDVEVLRNAQGMPYIVLNNGAKTIAEGMGITHIQVSLSHSEDSAVAFVVVE